MTRPGRPKTRQDAPKTRQRRPKRPQEVPRRPRRRTKIHPKSILMLKTSKIKKSLKNQWKINDFQGFGDHFSEVTSIVFRLAFMGYTQDVPRHSQDVLRRPQDAPRRPMAAPRRPQDAPKTPPGRPKTPPGAENKGLDLGSKSDFQRNRLQTSILEGLGLDFWRFWDGFWEVLRKIFEDFGLCLGCFGRVSSLAFLRSSTRHQTRHEGTGRLQQTNALPVPIKTGFL